MDNTKKLIINDILEKLYKISSPLAQTALESFSNDGEEIKIHNDDDLHDIMFPFKQAVNGFLDYTWKIGIDDYSFVEECLAKSSNYEYPSVRVEVDDDSPQKNVLILSIFVDAYISNIFEYTTIYSRADENIHNMEKLEEKFDEFAEDLFKLDGKRFPPKEQAILKNIENVIRKKYDITNIYSSSICFANDDDDINFGYKITFQIFM